MFLRKRGNGMLWLAASILIIAGCQKSQPSTQASATASQDSLAAIASSKDEAGKAFISVLEGIPRFEERLSYVSAHQAEATQVAQSKDPAITKRYTQLMTPPQMAPTPVPPK